MAQLGMDADVVEQLGRQLKSQAAEIGHLVTSINSLVSQMEQHWWGPDAQTFCHQWWPQHQRELHTAQQNIDGLGTSALNNAHDQRTVSGH